MRNARLFLFLTLTSFLLFGCPYNSEVALSTADSKAGEFLVGSWELPESSGSVVRITKGTGNLLNIEKTEAGYDGGEPSITNYTAHVTEIGGKLFLNVKEESEFSSGYYFYKLEKESDTKIVLVPVTANIREKFTNSAEMRTFFEKNMKNSYFFDSAEEQYYKVK